MGHRVLYIESCEHLKLYLDNLKVLVNADEILFPISDIMILVIDNYKSTLSVPLINKLVENNVCTIICGVDHLPKTSIMPINGNFSQSGNLFKQIEWNPDHKALIHQLIVKAKLHNQTEVLKNNRLNPYVIEKILSFREEVQAGDQTNREGLAAKMYFRELFGESFTRFDTDVINAGLNYGYAIFRSLISSIIVAKGYLPNLGIFHRGKQNMFNLSDDIIEVFRPIVDNYVYCHMRNDVLLTQHHKEQLIQLTTQKVSIDHRQQTIANAIHVYIESILNVMESGNPQDFMFPVPLFHDL